MFKMLGSSCIILFLITMSFMHGQVVMRALKTNGEPLGSVAIGQPFTVEIVVDGAQGTATTPSIDGIEKFTVKRVGMYMSSINGVSTTKFSYQVRIDEPGTHTIGPAHVNPHNKQVLTSDVITVRVGTEANALTHAGDKEKKIKHAQADSKVFLRLKVDKERVIVGQKIIGTLQLFYHDPEMQLVSIGKPDIAGFDMKTVGAPRGGYMEVNGVNYRYAEWTWDMYPTETGEYMFPAFSADYELPNKDKTVQGALFMFFNASRIDRKRIYSNAVKITVAPLPHYDGHVDAIGTFESISASIKPPMAKVGEGMVFALEIEGDCNWDAIATPKLSMPSELKYYDSEKNQGLTKKRFEFVVQGLQSGDWEIPEQLFTFFDTEKMMYKTIHSSSLLVTITSNNEMQLSEDDDYTIVRDNKHIEETLVTGIQAINERGYWYPIATKSLPWSIMQIFMIFPFFFFLSLFMRKKILFLRRSNPYLRKRKAFKSAQKAISVCSVSGDASQLYGIFRQFFLDCCEQISDIAVDSFINSERVSDAMSEDERKEWKAFLVDITQAAFGSSENNNGHSLCQVAYVWINRLRKII